jgi:hypothetical protein
MLLMTLKSFLHYKNMLMTSCDATDVCVKTGRPQVGGHDLWIVGLWCKEDEEDTVYLGLGPLKEVKPYVLLLLY